MKYLIFLLLSFNVYATDNSIFIEQIGSSNQTVINQTGSSNSITGLNQQNGVINGDGNEVNISQINNNVLRLSIIGHNNTMFSDQTVGNVLESNVQGSSNLLNFTQLNSANKSIISSILGNNNSIQSSQQGIGEHTLNITLTGNGHNVVTNQRDSGNHSATINLTNSGGASTLNLTQQGSVSQNYSIIQSCGIITGCLTSVNQQ